MKHIQKKTTGKTHQLHLLSVTKMFNTVMQNQYSDAKACETVSI